jgi:flagellar FliJ protein
MGRFRFPLEAVLEQRRRAERERQRVVAEHERDRLKLEAQLRTRQAVIDESAAELRSSLAAGGTIDASALRLRAASSTRAVAQAHELAIRLAGVHAKLHESRRGLTEASRQRRAVERLRELRHDAWRQERERAEQRDVDEIAQTLHARRVQGAEGPAEEA